MDHTVLIDRWFSENGYRMQFEWNCFQPPYDPTKGWPMRLPAVDWIRTDFLLIVLQDFVTMRDGICQELIALERRYGDKANRVIVLHWPHNLVRYYHGPLRLVEFNWHEYTILNNLARKRHQWVDIWHAERDLAWQCLNGRKCDHRTSVVNYLVEHWQDGTVSYDDIIPLPEYPYGTYRGTPNETNWRRLLPVYGRHHVNIVTETQYDQQPGIITEKTIFALLSAQIPLVIGYQGIVQDCQELGFDMFPDIIDVSYDQLPDHCRWQAALDLNRDTILNFQCSPQLKKRLVTQAEWLLTKWPQQHLQCAIDQLRTIVTAQG